MADDSSTPIFDLSSQVEPTLTFTVDGEPYELRTVSHLNTFEEAKLRRLVRREEQLVEQLAKPGPMSDAVLARIGQQIVDLRVELIEMMTTLPKELIVKLPPTAQQQIVRAIGQGVESLESRREETSEGEE